MATYEYERYICNKETLKETLEKFGVAIIPNVLNEEECNQMVDEMWNFFEHISGDWVIPLKRDDKTTWKEFYDNIFALHSMLVQHWGIGHSQASWNVRQNEKIIDIFAQLWGTNELLVSFDGSSFNLPPEVTKRGWNKNNTWYHTDQSYKSSDLESIQSWVTGLDVEKGDATLGIMEGSHKYHKEFQEKFNVTNKEDWYKLSREQESFYVEKGCTYKKIMCPKGSMVFWDSRTIHCGVEADKNRSHEKLRAVIYLCYMPREWCDKQNLVKKRKAFEELRTTTHNPCKIRLFPKIPRTYGKPVPKMRLINPPNLTKLGKRLAGFKDE